MAGNQASITIGSRFFGAICRRTGWASFAARVNCQVQNKFLPDHLAVAESKWKLFKHRFTKKPSSRVKTQSSNNHAKFVFEARSVFHVGEFDESWCRVGTFGLLPTTISAGRLALSNG
jgi:hypothetical protein